MRWGHRALVTGGAEAEDWAWLGTAGAGGACVERVATMSGLGRGRGRLEAAKAVPCEKALWCEPSARTRVVAFAERRTLAM